MKKVQTLMTRVKQSKTLKILACLFVMAVISPDMLANSPGAAAIATAETAIKGYLKPVQNLIYAIAGVVAVIGAFSVYVKMNNEEQDVKKSIMMVVGACVFLIAAATALPAFFS
ncbi:DUF4134 domain-containing protein [Porphyromonas levii]|uniref:DUF4134 domain-containing protein n=1 Tax=Porphyromonas levii TaxID=28114 RepID=A0A4Y8WLR0_9PORP|nr:DUF4134 domain-containing protein [Porphyromonas levii]TFH93956.1 DUF4134 domain-containing protein [Porphyromonas levii]TFH96836.1 DUF4134 domain-containing protein [Porphyromonas levii]